MTVSTKPGSQKQFTVLVEVVEVVVVVGFRVVVVTVVVVVSVVVVEVVVVEVVEVVVVKVVVVMVVDVLVDVVFVVVVTRQVAVTNDGNCGLLILGNKPAVLSSWFTLVMKVGKSKSACAIAGLPLFSWMLTSISFVPCIASQLIVGMMTWSSSSVPGHVAAIPAPKALRKAT